MSCASSTASPPWENQWAVVQGDPSTVVAVVAQGKTPKEDVVFYFSRSLLISSCSYFATALSLEWSINSNNNNTEDEDNDTEASNDIDSTNSAESTATALESLSLETNSMDTTADADADADCSTDNVDTSLPALATITFQESPRAVHGVLSYIDPKHTLWLLPETVEPTLQLADLIGLDGLKAECEKFLMRKISWDAPGALYLAEKYRLEELYWKAGNAILRSDTFYQRRAWYQLRMSTVAKLLTGRQIFSMRVAAVAVKDIQGRLENKCTACGYARSTSQEGMVRTMQAARNAKPGCVDALLRAVDHSLTCDGPVGTRDLLKIIELDARPPAEDQLRDDVPDDLCPLLFWTTKNVCEPLDRASLTNCLVEVITKVWKI